MNEQHIEQEIQAKGLTAPRLTPADIDATIKRVEYYHVAGTTTTVCMIVTRNGFVVTGKSACVSPENFNQSLGRRIAYDDARSRIWELEGYLLRDRLSTTQSQDEPGPIDVEYASDGDVGAVSVPVRLVNGQSMPARATAGSACFDLRAAHDAAIHPGRDEAIRTGICVALPAGYAMLLFSRSGHGVMGVSLSNSVGVIDSDYRGEVLVRLRNDGADSLHIEAGDRIAQAMVIALPRVTLLPVSWLPSTDRGAGGFGSTGTK